MGCITVRVVWAECFSSDAWRWYNTTQHWQFDPVGKNVAHISQHSWWKEEKKSRASLLCSCLLLHWKLLPGHWVIALIALMWNSGQVYADVDVFYLFKFEVLGKTADLHMEIVQNMAFWDQSEKKLQQWWKRSRNIQGECFLWGEQPDSVKYGILFLISEHQDCTLYNTQGPGWMKDPRGWKLLRHLHCGGIILWDCAKKV